MLSFIKKILGISTPILFNEEIPEHIPEEILHTKNKIVEKEVFDISIIEDDNLIQKSYQNNKSNIIKKENNMTDLNNMWIVTLDTTNRTEAKSFPKGLQNFWFVYANSEDECKSIIWASFRNDRNIVSQLWNSVKCTQLKLVIGKMSERSNFWSYIPRGNQRLPGQQSLIPDPNNLLMKDQYGVPSSQNYQPQRVEIPTDIARELQEEAIRDAELDARREIGNPNKNPVIVNNNQHTSNTELVMSEMLKLMQGMKEEINLLKQQK